MSNSRQDPGEVIILLTKAIGKGILWGGAGILALGLGLNIYEEIESRDYERV
tara:strand:+ start:136 stop:291 length:156 start_codon:yes stop_codon:yes gene_type:complete